MLKHNLTVLYYQFSLLQISLTATFDGFLVRLLYAQLVWRLTGLCDVTPVTKRMYRHRCGAQVVISSAHSLAWQLLLTVHSSIDSRPVYSKEEKISLWTFGTLYKNFDSMHSPIFEFCFVFFYVDKPTLNDNNPFLE